MEREQVHPGKASFRQALALPQGQPDENHAEIRQGRVEDIDHGKVVFWQRFATIRMPGAGPGRGEIGPMPPSIGSNHGLFDKT